MNLLHRLRSWRAERRALRQWDREADEEPAYPYIREETRIRRMGFEEARKRQRESYREMCRRMARNFER